MSAAERGKDYISFINYDHKNTLEAFAAKNNNPLKFPGFLLVEADQSLSLEGLDPDPGNINPGIALRPVISPERYLQDVEALKQHIRLGDIYEVNYCMSFEAFDTQIDPIQLYTRLNDLSSASYSALLKTGKQYIISSSPELFLSRRGDRLLSKPIKGTARRSDKGAEDEAIRKALYHSAKERNENVMIVDVVRNDLSRLATRASVQVDKLFDIESYRQVHQMVSTVSCSLKGDPSFEDMIAATFPMASMTGAPKYRAMQLIDQYEAYNRGPYSGSLGYIRANGDFDLNVLIRSVFYDAAKCYLSFSVGSAITDMCQPEEEYEECLLKAKALVQALGGR